MRIPNSFNTNRKLYLATLLSFSFLHGELAYGDSTFFPEDKTAEKPIQEASEAIKEWAELKPAPKKEATKAIPPQQPEATETEAFLSQPQIEATKEENTPAETIIVSQEETTSITEAPANSPTIQEQKPAETIIVSSETTTDLPEISTATKENKSIEALAPLPESKPSITEVSEISPTIEEKKAVETLTTLPEPKPSLAEASTPPATTETKPLEVTKVDARPKPVPVLEEPQTASNGKEQANTSNKVVSYSDAANDRSPLGILSSNQEVHNQRWYIYSSAIRGLKNPSDIVQIVSMVGAPAKRGEDIKSLLIEMGIESDKIQLIHAKGEEDQAGTTYIFAGK